MSRRLLVLNIGEEIYQNVTVVKNEIPYAKYMRINADIWSGRSVSVLYVTGYVKTSERNHQY